MLTDRSSIYEHMFIYILQSFSKFMSIYIYIYKKLFEDENKMKIGGY